MCNLWLNGEFLVQSPCNLDTTRSENYCHHQLWCLLHPDGIPSHSANRHHPQIFSGQIPDNHSLAQKIIPAFLPVLFYLISATAVGEYLQMMQIGTDFQKVRKSKTYPRIYKLDSDLLGIVWNSRIKKGSKARSKFECVSPEPRAESVIRNTPK